MAVQTISPPHTASQGTRRSAEDMDITPTKRRKLYHHHHGVRFKQPFEADPVLHCQDERLAQGQLDRSLATVLYSAGFDTATPDAFEALRASTQEFMLHFASRVRKSMLSSRRTQPLPQDFVLALSQNSLSPAALSPHLAVPVPPEFALPRVVAPQPDETQAPALDPILGDELDGDLEKARRPYISKTFPKLPSRHTWKSTLVFPTREDDPRRIRERATQEGVLAEQALRKLAAAKKSRAPRRQDGRMTARNRAVLQKEKLWDAASASVLQNDQEELRRFEERQLAEGDGAEGLVDHGARRSIEPGDVDKAILVNCDRKNWRKAPGAVIRA